MQLLAIQGKCVTILLENMILIEFLHEIIMGETFHKPPKPWEVVEKFHAL
jgi:hypothetical protein